MRVLEVRNGWNGVERSWNEVRDIYVGIFRPIGSAGVHPILAKGLPKRVQMAQKWPKSDFEAVRNTLCLLKQILLTKYVKCNNTKAAFERRLQKFKVDSKINYDLKMLGKVSTIQKLYH